MVGLRPSGPGGGRVSTLPDLDVARVQRWCRARVPERASHQVRVECVVAPRHLTIVERRAPWGDSSDEWSHRPIAQLRYADAGQTWSLYACDRNQRFREYDQAVATTNVEELLAELDRDSTRIFWG
jgi:hypothetical protein